MISDTITEMQKLFEGCCIEGFRVSDVGIEGDYVKVVFEKKRTLGEYLSRTTPGNLIFISGNKTYNIQRCFANVEGVVKVFLSVHEDGKFKCLLSSYECKHQESFSIPIFEVCIDKIIKEVF